MQELQVLSLATPTKITTQSFRWDFKTKVMCNDALHLAHKRTNVF